MSDTNTAPNETTTAPEQAAEAEDGGDIYAFARDLLGDPGESEDASPPPSESTPAAPVKTDEAKAPEAAPPATPQEPTLEEKIRAEAEKSFADREAKREQERYASEIKRQQDELAAEKKRVEELRRAYEQDPIEFLRRTYGDDLTAAYDRLHKAALDPQADKTSSKIDAKLSEIEQLKQRLEERERAFQQQEQQRQYVEEHQRAVAALHEHVTSSQDYPLLAKLPPELRAARASTMAERLVAAGHDAPSLDFATVARYAEQELRDLAAHLGGTSEARQQPAAPSSTPPDRSGRPPTTISAAQTSERASMPDEETFEERVEAAKRLARDVI